MIAYVVVNFPRVAVTGAPLRILCYTLIYKLPIFHYCIICIFSQIITVVPTSVVPTLWHNSKCRRQAQALNTLYAIDDFQNLFSTLNYSVY